MPSAARIEAHSCTEVDKAWLAFHHRHLPPGLIRYTTFELTFALRHRQSFDIPPNVFNKLPAFQMRLVRVGTNTARSSPWAAIIAKYAKRFSPKRTALHGQITSNARQLHDTDVRILP
jgi:hypothetical protein